MIRLTALALAATIGLAACIFPAREMEDLTCTEDGRCAPGYSCVSGRCLADDADASHISDAGADGASAPDTGETDASARDASSIDGAQRDASSPDGAMVDAARADTSVPDISPADSAQTDGSGIPAPTLVLSDPTTASSIYSRQQAVSVLVGNDAGATRWCLSEIQTVRPGTGASTCFGGMGPAEGWHTARPVSFELSAEQGQRTVHAWIADANGVVSSGPGTAVIILDSHPPATPTVSLADPSSGSTTTADESPVTLTISDDSDAASWCIYEQSASDAAPTPPLWNASCWRGSRPGAQGMGASGERAVYVYTRDAALNVSASAGSATIEYLGTAFPTLATRITRADASTLYAAGYYNIAGVSRWIVRKSVDNGVSWTVKDEYDPNPPSRGQALALVAQGDVVYVGGRANDRYWTVRRSSNGGQAWATVDETLGSSTTNTMVRDLVLDASGAVYAVGQLSEAATIRVSANGDLGSWTTARSVCCGQATVAGANIQGDQVFSAEWRDFNDATDEWTRWMVFRSVDDGASWAEVDMFEEWWDTYPHAFGRDSAGSLYFAGVGSDESGVDRWYLRTSPDGASWTQRHARVATGRPADICDDGAGGLYIVGRTVNEWIVYKSSDSGATWDEKDRFHLVPGRSAWAASCDATTNLVLVIGVGRDTEDRSHWLLRASYDGGESWSLLEDYVHY